jgi:hypothetical protein
MALHRGVKAGHEPIAPALARPGGSSAAWRSGVALRYGGEAEPRRGTRQGRTRSFVLDEATTQRDKAQGLSVHVGQR